VATAKACAKIPDGTGEKEIFSADIKLFCCWSCAVVLGAYNVACDTFCSYCPVLFFLLLYICYLLFYTTQSPSAPVNGTFIAKSHLVLAVNNRGFLKKTNKRGNVFSLEQ
jgi:hypothetical protein